MIRPTSNEIANEIRMRRSQFSGTFLIVEGRDDRLFMENFISQSTCKIEVAEGKQRVCDVIYVLDKDNFDGVLGLIDADFDRIEGVPDRSQNLVMPDSHDLIMMLVNSPALDRVLTEHGSRKKLETFEENVLQALIDRGAAGGISTSAFPERQALLAIQRADLFRLDRPFFFCSGHSCAN